MNSEPNELVSMPVCFFDDQYIGALFRKTMKPVRERLVIKLPAWSASTYARIVKPRPLGGGMLSAICSVASL